MEMSNWIVGSPKGLTGPSTPNVGGATVGEGVYWDQHPGADSIPTKLHHAVVSCDRETIAIIPAGPHKDERARLFAAARELLEACRYALEAIESLQRDKDGSIISPAYSQLRRAIAKATGEKP